MKKIESNSIDENIKNFLKFHKNNDDDFRADFLRSMMGR